MKKTTCENKWFFCPYSIRTHFTASAIKTSLFFKPSSCSTNFTYASVNGNIPAAPIHHES